MRGFQYYTGLVFEVFDKHPENNRALFGGGRYDNLVGLFGGQALPGVGFGMGDVTFRNFLESHGLLPNFTESSGVYVMAMDESLLIDAQKVAAAIRTGLIARGNNTGVMAALTAEKVKKAFVSAEKLRCRYIVFVGSDEAATGRFNMKDTKTQTQHSGTTADLAQAIEQTASL
jgi:histidyl-tRNA synthetase